MTNCAWNVLTLDWTVTVIDKLEALGRARSWPGGELPEGWVDEVLGFWFEELQPADWFKKSDETDRLIGERFLTLYGKLSTLPVDAIGSVS